MCVLTPITGHVGVPESSWTIRAVCIKADGTWENKPQSTRQRPICAWTGEKTHQ